jgi:hypothetical protein
MNRKIAITLLAATMILATLVATGCARRPTPSEAAPPNDDPLVFGDNFGDGVDFQAFQGSDVYALSVDSDQFYAGTSSLRIVVPAPGSAGGTYAGGAFTTGLARDLRRYNALTFYAKATLAASLDVAGLGNDNTGNSLYEAKRASLQLGTEWQLYTIPIPLPEKLAQEKGLFFFAEGPEGGQGYTIWFDEVRFDSLSTVTNPRPSIVPQTVNLDVGSYVTVQNTQVLFDIAGVINQPVQCMSNYFSFTPADTNVVKIVDGRPLVVGPGTTTLTAKLGEVAAGGLVTVHATARPTTAPPAPTLPAADVISLFSNAYPNRTVDTWSAGWDLADVSDTQIQGDDAKRYTSLTYAGIEFTSSPIDATAMTHFHLDAWAPSGTYFRVKLVDFGANGTYDGGGDDREHELTFTALTTPAFTANAWASLEIPLADFTNLTTRGHLAQLVISGNVGTVYIDNIYFHK